MLDTDAEAFDRVIQDLCLAFNRPHSTELTRVYWESLRHVHIADVKRAALSARNNLKKFPAPKDLIPERRYAPPEVRAPEPQMSTWAMAANKILFSVAYQGHRGFVPMGEMLKPCLVAKADYVRMAEEAEAGGDLWDTHDFNVMCREGFQKILAA